MSHQISGVTGIKNMHNRLVAIFKEEAPGRIIGIIGRSFWSTPRWCMTDLTAL